AKICGSRCGTSRTSAGSRGGDRSCGSGCNCAPRTSASSWTWQSETSSPLAGLLRLGTERHAQVLQEQPRFLVGAGTGHEGDVHAPRLVDLGVVDLGEDELVAQAQGVVAAPVEGPGGHAPEVAHAGQGHVEEAVDELVHAV